ncbi:GIY-YIG nuclease family protein [Paenibacillus rhizovicinus]|uniref:GIY-YIG nuclease family protein n=1 Tax=Paenibacillus rhizovicinus TaxID=2704463 RepID=UPI001CDCDAC0|nr:GIY-YIG nuclease family protein [Paenibacillus rhizovicinus]
MDTAGPFVFKASNYPEKPGCYLMRDAAGQLLYVGKSKKLRSRLRSYFTTRHTRKRTYELVANIASIEIILVNNETESLLLENNLIKIHKPPYNRALKKDNSGYAYLELTGERIPRLAVHYRDRREPAPASGARYGTTANVSGSGDAAVRERAQAEYSAEPEEKHEVGRSQGEAAAQIAAGSEAGMSARPGMLSVRQPGGTGHGEKASERKRSAGYPNANANANAKASSNSSVNANAKANSKTAGETPAYEPKRFGPFANARFRTELLEFLADHYKLRSCAVLPKRACLLYHLGRCSGVCEGHITEEAYAQDVKQLSELLFGGTKDALIARMYGQMAEYAEQLKFEKAQNMLEHIRNLEKTPERQIVDRETSLNQEVLYFGDEGVMIAKVQQGMLRDFQLHELERGFAETACDRFLIQRYRIETKPDELIVNRIADPAAVRRALRRPGEGQAPGLRITQPKRGLKHELLQLCKQNYEYRKGGGE